MIKLGARHPSKKERKPASLCGKFETQEPFSQAYSTHTITYAHLSLFIFYWNMQENADSSLFWACDWSIMWRFPAVLRL